MGVPTPQCLKTQPSTSTAHRPISLCSSEQPQLGQENRGPTRKRILPRTSLAQHCLGRTGAQKKKFLHEKIQISTMHIH